MIRLVIRKFCLLALLAGIWAPLRAQDTLVTVHGTEMYVKLLEVKTDLVLYKLPPPDTTVYKLPFQEVFMIKYGNGDRQVFAENITPPEPPALELTASQLQALGNQDARKYYDTKIATGITGFISLINPIAGLFTALGYTVNGSVSMPQVSDTRLLKEPVYVKAYKKEAKRKRTNAAFKGFGIGASVFVVAIYTITEINK